MHCDRTPCTRRSNPSSELVAGGQCDPKPSQQMATDKGTADEMESIVRMELGDDS